MIKQLSFSFVLLCLTNLFSQTESLEVKTNNLDEIVLNTNRIDLPLSEHSITLQIINADEIQKSGATNLVVLLQQISGID
ncbi:MAG: TonB-dependent receptor, partial [Flavobacteriaceae bacterium]|nr:TonB-dependent receptor [Flavobacteriaceae bacterium]